MNKEHYNQIIDWTVQQEQLEDKRNTLEAARLIFKNMGIPLPNGTMEEAATVLATNDYMGWRKCTAKEAQICANDGTAAMTVKGNEIYIVKAESDGKDEVATVHSANNDTVSIPSQLADQEDVQFYAYRAANTVVPPSGGVGGEYRYISGGSPYCLGYALLRNANDSTCNNLVSLVKESSLQKTARYANVFKEAILKADGIISCRQIDSFSAPIYYNEYRIAVRAPNYNGNYYHVIYQLSDETWAGKDADGPSKHFSWGNPSYSPEMWSNDRYPEAAGTIYFAVNNKRAK